MKLKLTGIDDLFMTIFRVQISLKLQLMDLVVNTIIFARVKMRSKNCLIFMYLENCTILYD